MIKLIQGLGPQPRFRINSKCSDYTKSFKAFFFESYSKIEACENLEHEISRKFNSPYAISMPQARVGIYLGILASVKAGKEVILSPNTIADVINMVICAGAKPVFGDIDPATGNMDPNQVEKLITANTAAIMVTHLYGLLAPMNRFKELGERYDLLIIEDSAQAFGARQNDRYAGTFGDIGVYSFGMAKNVTSYYGGMLVTRRKDIAETVRHHIEKFPVVNKWKLQKKIISCLVKDNASSDLLFPTFFFHMFKFAYRHKIKSITKLIEAELDLSRKECLPESYKERMSFLQAELILSKLPNLEKDFKHRLECARLYYKGLKDIPDLLLPPMNENGSHIYNYYPIGYRNRESLRMHLMSHNRDVALQHMKNTADLPAFKDYYRDCPSCRQWANQTLMMPNYAKYRFSEVEKNVSVIRQFFRK